MCIWNLMSHRLLSSEFKASILKQVLIMPVSADTALFFTLRYLRLLISAQGAANCIKACPTKAIRLYNDNPTCLTDKCIRCGECLRVCSTGAISTTTYELEALQKDKVSIALVSPVLYSQFKGVMPNDILLAVKKIRFSPCNGSFLLHRNVSLRRRRIYCREQNYRAVAMASHIAGMSCGYQAYCIPVPESPASPHAYNEAVYRSLQRKQESGSAGSTG